jgi:hypothetical protein
MKNFYDSTDIRQNIQLPVICTSGILLIDGVRTGIAPLLSAFVINVTNPGPDTAIYVDGNEIYPKFKMMAQHTDLEIQINVNRAFYSWYHVVAGRGWILYDHSTY